MEEEESKREFIKQRLKRDVLSIDLQWSLFVAALQSYRHDSVLRPFPAQFQDGEGGKDYVGLAKTVEELPFIGVLLEADDCKKKASREIVDLTYWLLRKPFDLKFCEKDKFSEITSNLLGMQPSRSTPQPHFIFEVIHDSASSQKFSDLCRGRDLFYACHGSRLENFHSILHYGLQGHLSKNAMFGEGTYLSAELSMCFLYAPTGKSWQHSLLGENLSCIAVSEIIDDDSVKCQVKKRVRRSVAGSMGGEVPEKYYVVRNNDMMRVKYLLIYAGDQKKTSLERSVVVRWMLRHKFILMIIFYAFVLISVSLFNSKAFNYHIKKLFKR